MHTTELRFRQAPAGLVLTAILPMPDCLQAALVAGEAQARARLAAARPAAHRCRFERSLRQRSLAAEHLWLATEVDASGPLRVERQRGAAAQRALGEVLQSLDAVVDHADKALGRPDQPLASGAVASARKGRRDTGSPEDLWCASDRCYFNRGRPPYLTFALDPGRPTTIIAVLKSREGCVPERCGDARFDRLLVQRRRRPLVAH